jgi:hypothetical protein
MEEFSRCAICDRTPLVGEGISVFSGGKREAAVCDLCLAKPRASALGEVVRRERIHTAAGAETVKRVIPAPVHAGAPARPARRRSGRSAPLPG